MRERKCSSYSKLLLIIVFVLMTVVTLIACSATGNQSTVHQDEASKTGTYSPKMEIENNPTEHLGTTEESKEYLLTEESVIQKPRILSVTEYNPKGKITKETCYYTDCSEGLSEESICEYIYNDKGLLEQIITYYDILETYEKEEFTYDSFGRLVLRCKDGEMVEEYQYDADGNCIKEWFVDTDGENLRTYEYKDGKIVSMYEEMATEVEIETEEGYAYANGYHYYYTEYDSQERIAKMTCYEFGDSPYYEVYSYTEDSKVIVKYDLAGNQTGKFTVRYDAEGRVMEKEMQYYTLPEYNWRNEYEYTDCSLKQRYFNETGKLEAIYIFTWNEYNNLISEEQYEADGEKVCSWVYEYDSNNMLQREIQTVEGVTTISVGPDREYYSDGTIKKVTCYEDIDYIPQHYFLTPPKLDQHYTNNA